MGLLRKANYAKRLMTHPCATPNPEVVVETALQAGALTVIDYFTWGCRDIIKLRAGRGEPCGRLLSALKRSATPQRAAGIGTAILDLARPVDIGLYYWFIAELASDFLINWSTLMYQSQNCTLPGAGFARVGVGNHFYAPLNQVGPISNIMPNIPGRVTGGLNGDMHVHPGIYANLSVNIKWRQATELGPGGSMAVFVTQEDGKILGAAPAPQNPQAENNTALTFASHLNSGGLAGADYRIRAIVNGGWVEQTGGDISVSAYGRPIDVIPSGCVPMKGASFSDRLFMPYD